jgi:hypothetical protein
LLYSTFAAKPKCPKQTAAKPNHRKEMSRLELDCLKQSSSCSLITLLKPERAILEVLFPRGRAEILRLLFITPPKERYVRELVRMSGLTLCTVQDELRKLSAIQLVTSWSDRYHRFYHANRDHPLFPELVRLVEKSARLPRTKHAALHRKRHARKPRRRRPAARPGDWPAKWNLFAGPPKNSTV